MLQENKLAPTFFHEGMDSIAMNVSFGSAITIVWHASQSPAMCLILAVIPGRQTTFRTRRTICCMRPSEICEVVSDVVRLHIRP